MAGIEESKLGIDALLAVQRQSRFTVPEIAKTLGRPSRTVYSWFAMTKYGRNVPDGEVERLCLLLDPEGKRQDIIGWIVIAARARYADQIVLPTGVFTATSFSNNI